MPIRPARALHRIRSCLQRVRRRFVSPINIVRVCRKRSDLILIVNEASQSSPPWMPELVERVTSIVLDGCTTEISVYEIATTDPLDHGHALGVIAEGIFQEDFRPNAKKRKAGCTRGTLLIPTSSLPRNAHVRFTPKNNLNFFPADIRHYDLSASDAQELATAILDGIHNKMIRWVFLANEDKSYRVQAAVAYSYCLSMFGKLDQGNPPFILAQRQKP
jgi:hypothetical protein